MDFRYLYLISRPRHSFNNLKIVLLTKVIMILERDFPPDLRVENEISALLEKGIEVHVACYTFSKKDSVESYNGYTIHRKKISSFIYKSSVGALKLPLLSILEVFCFETL